MKVMVMIATFVCATAWCCPDGRAADHIGVYFDLNASTYCIEPQSGESFVAYVTIVEPSSPEIYGVEFRLQLGGSGMGLFLLGTEWLGATTASADWSVGTSTGFHVMFSEPLVSGSTVAQVWAAELFLAWGSVRDFYLRPATVPTIDNGLPAYFGPDASVIPLYPTSGDVMLPVASAGGPCRTVSVQESTFGSVKSLFR